MTTNMHDERSGEMHDPTKDKYLELEKKVGAAEYELAADIAAGNKAVGEAAEAAREKARAKIGDIRHGREKRQG